jgi:hypothetical protein
VVIKLEIKEHSKDPDIVEVDSYDAKQIYEFITKKDENNTRVNEFIQFNENIYSTINIQSIKVVE